MLLMGLLYHSRYHPIGLRDYWIHKSIHPNVKIPGVCIEIGSGTIPICGLCVETGLAKSNSEAKRLLSQGAIQIDGERVNTDTVCIKDGSVIKVGKRRFVRIVDADKR